MGKYMRKYIFFTASEYFLLVDEESYIYSMVECYCVGECVGEPVYTKKGKY